MSNQRVKLEDIQDINYCLIFIYFISGLVMLQTTNSVFNTSLLQYVTPQSLLAWHRVRLANLMAQNGEEWADVYKQYNSGIMFSYVSGVCTVA